MAGRSAGQMSWADVVVGVLPLVGLLGVVGIVVAVALGLEEPHQGLLGVGGALLTAPLVGLFVHLAFSGEFDRSQRLGWCRAFLGRYGPGLMLAYFDAEQRRVLTRWLRVAESRKPASGAAE